MVGKTLSVEQEGGCLTALSHFRDNTMLANVLAGWASPGEVMDCNHPLFGRSRARTARFGCYNVCTVMNVLTLYSVDFFGSFQVSFQYLGPAATPETSSHPLFNNVTCLWHLNGKLSLSAVQGLFSLCLRCSFSFL